jgi:tripartite-type tricarboxylate transporter receptor subunit TctC
MTKLAGIAVAIAAIVGSGIAQADDAWPSRPIKLIVPFAPGGNTDVVARVTANYMQNALHGAAIVVENRAGAGGINGTAAVAKGAPDGYTLCVCSVGAISIAPSTEKLPYDPITELMPVSMINTNPLVLIVNPKLPIKTSADVVALSKSKPGGLTYGSSGVGGLMYFSAEIYKAKTGAELTHVPYRGGALATTAVVSGEVDIAFAHMSDAIAQISAGTVRSIGITTPQRSPFIPDVPTFLEQGINGFVTESWNAMLAPPGTPKPIVDRLATIMSDMAKDAEIQKSMANFGSVPVANSPDEFGRQIKSEIAQWETLLKDIGYTNK